MHCSRTDWAVQSRCSATIVPANNIQDGMCVNNQGDTIRTTANTRVVVSVETGPIFLRLATQCGECKGDSLHYRRRWTADGCITSLVRRFPIAKHLGCGKHGEGLHDGTIQPRKPSKNDNADDQSDPISSHEDGRAFSNEELVAWRKQHNRRWIHELLAS